MLHWPTQSLLQLGVPARLMLCDCSQSEQTSDLQERGLSIELSTSNVSGLVVVVLDGSWLGSGWSWILKTHLQSSYSEWYCMLLRVLFTEPAG